MLDEVSGATEKETRGKLDDRKLEGVFEELAESKHRKLTDF
jgi:hypothetical protein